MPPGQTQTIFAYRVVKGKLNNMQKESNKSEIVVSKIIFGILAIYIIYWFGFNISSNREFIIDSFQNKNYFAGFIFAILTIAISIFQIVILVQIFQDKTSEYVFTNFEREFHPFFKDENQEDELNSYIGISIFTVVIYFVIPWILQYFMNDYNLDPATLLAGYVHIGVILAISERKKTLNKLPIKLMKANNIRLMLKYDDYLNEQISDDEPHLIINQAFELNIKHLPRNEREKNLIEIRNNNTPNNSALIARIEDVGLANAIRSGDVIKTRLVSIREFAELEIEISID